MKKYLITGCAGFIGSNFVYYMLKKYEDILLVNLDKLTYAGNLENLKGVEGDLRHIFVQGDICDKELVAGLFEKYDFDYVIDTPFIVINADDYYGKEGFKAVHDYLVNGGKSCMAGFVLKNALSDNGGVTRGICKMDENGNLTEVVETKNIVKTANGAEADGVVVDVNSLVSMNMWGLTPEFLDVLENGFKEFFKKEVPSNPQKAEYLIPIFIGELLEQGKMFVKVLKTDDTWYGMTYHEDVAAVKDSFKKMLADGVYKADLFSDL